MLACGSTPKPALAPVVLPAAKPEARQFFEEGLRILHRGSGADALEAAAEQFTKAVKEDHKLFEAWHDLGVIRARQGQWPEALDAFRAALALQPASRRTLVGLGEALGRTGEWEEAAKLYGERLAADPKDDDLRLRHIQALRESGQTSEALEAARALLTKDGKNAAAFNALGLVYYRMNKLPLAESAFRRAVELDPKAKATAAVWNNIGLVALARGNDQEAFVAFEKASAIDGDHREAHLNQATVYLDCGDYKRAEKEIRKAIEIDHDDPDAYVALGVALRGQKRFDEARAAYERALAARPNHPPALYDLGILYMDFQQNKDKARENLTLYRKLAGPHDPKRADAAARLKELK
ncbi:MAG TPA: tetratricopeptide repeat protein [Polyangia bacterium]|nr:tetratricopeptide repeat protein [Polyangia bacterium]